MLFKLKLPHGDSSKVTVVTLVFSCQFMSTMVLWCKCQSDCMFLQLDPFSMWSWQHNSSRLERFKCYCAFVFRNVYIGLINITYISTYTFIHGCLLQLAKQDTLTLKPLWATWSHLWFPESMNVHRGALVY